MRSGSLLALLAILVTLPACRGAGTTSVDEPPRTATTEQIPPAQTPPPWPRADMPPGAPLAVLGAPCSPASAPTSRNAPFDTCGTKGRVSVRWDPGTHGGAFAGGEVSCRLVDLDRSRFSKDPPPFNEEPRRACVKDGKVWATTTCAMCRMPFAGWSAVAVISEMTKEQALAFQARLRLPKDVPLTTAEAWASALASAAN